MTPTPANDPPGNDPLAKGPAANDPPDARRAEGGFLFEHGGRGVARRFVLTYVLSAFPRRFWSRVTPADPVRGGGLVAYWALANALFVAVAVAAVLAEAVPLARANVADRATAYTPVAGKPGLFTGRLGRSREVVTQGDIDEADPRPLSLAFAAEVYRSPTFPRVAEAAAVAAGWPWLTAVGLLVYRTAARQPTVRPGQLLRTAIYAGDVALLLFVLTVSLYGTRAALGPLASRLPAASGPAYDLFAPGHPLAAAGPFGGSMFAVAVLVSCGVVAVRLAAAHARYFRAPHPVRAAVASQVIVGVLIFFVALQLR